jgi:FlgD Ig-like domain
VFSSRILLLSLLWLTGINLRAKEVGRESGPSFEVAIESDCQISGEIVDQQGNLVRSLRPLGPLQAGTHKLAWDGLTDKGVAAPAGEYECRIILNPTVYKTAGGIGNTSLPPNTNHNPSDIQSVAADVEGHVYTANLWEEAAQDFRKWNRDDGLHVFDSKGSIRNGNPNALAYAIAVDEKYIYCATYSHTTNAQQHIRRFRLADGEPAPFPAAANGGHILVHDRPEEKAIKQGIGHSDDLWKQPLRALAVAGGKLFATDALDGKVLSFNKETGAPLGSFSVKFPHALAIDAAGNLWVGHEGGAITVFSQDGERSVPVLKTLKHIRALAFGPNNLLYVADSGTNKVHIFRADPAKGTATFLLSFGQQAKPGDSAPDRFYKLSGLAIDPPGNFTIAQSLPVTGARLTRFAPDGRVIWDQLGAEFTNTGNTSNEHPDELISQVLHRYKLNKNSGSWEFRGCVLDGDSKYIRWMHGPMRLQKLQDNEFLFQGYGDGLQVYRRYGDVYRLASMFGRGNPFPDGKYHDLMKESERPAKDAIWSWSDVNADGRVSDWETTWIRDPEAVSAFHNFGISIDRHGNALMCNEAVTEIPMTGFDASGNPIYDLNKMRVIVPQDKSDNAVLAAPIMAVRADDGSIYVQGRSKFYPKPPEADFGWMAGWVLARFDADGKLLWQRQLPEACPGMDAIPGGGGVMLVSIKWGNEGSDIYHYSDAGALIGITQPSAKFRTDRGIPDNTASLGISRDPRDGILDVFVEDCIGNRFYWLRVDDRKKPEVRSQRFRLEENGAPVAR